MEDQILQQILSELKSLKQGQSEMRDDISSIKQDVSLLKQDVSLLKQDVSLLKQDVSLLKQDVSLLKQGQTRIETKLNTIYDHTANLTEFRTETKLNFIETNDKIDDIQIDLNSLTTKTSKNSSKIIELSQRIK